MRTQTIDPFMVYVNTRVRALKSLLLSKDQLEESLNHDDIRRMVEFMLSTPYDAEMAESLTRYQGADAVEDAVSRNLVHTFQRLSGFLQGDSHHLGAMFLQRWDLAAAKAILRTKHHDLSPEQALEDIMPGPTLTMALIQDLVERDSMSAVVAGLVAWKSRLGRAVEQHLDEYHETHNLGVLEDALDRHYFVDHVRRLKPRRDFDSRFLVRVLQMEIDRINLRILFALRRNDSDSQKVLDRLLPQASLSKEMLLKMSEATSTEQTMEVLGPTAYRVLALEIFQFIQTGRFSSMERVFEKLFIDEIWRVARTNVFSIAVLMQYTWLKYNEVMNLRLIARGVSRHLPPGRVHEELVYV